MKALWRTSLIMMLATLAGSGSFAESADLDVLDLGGRGRLHGRLLRVDAAEDVLVWEHPAAREPLAFSLSHKRELILSGRATPRHRAAPSTLWFSDNGMIRGSLVQITDEHVVFDTWYAGSLRIPRNMVRRIIPGIYGETVIYEGPRDPGNWYYGEGEDAWVLETGVLVARGGGPLGRSFERLPDLCAIEMDFSWNGYLNFFLAFYAGDEKAYNRNSYALRFDGNSVQPHVFDGEGQSRALGDRARNNILNPAPEGRRVRLSVYVNRLVGEISVVVNDNFLGTWKDPQPGVPEGSNIAIQQLMRGLAIHNFRIEQWNGVLPRMESNIEESNRDVLVMHNHDIMSGKLISMADDKIKFETSFALIDVPTNRVRSVQFNTTGLRMPTFGEYAVRAFFPGFGHMTFNLVKIEQGMIEGYSEALGEVSMPLEAFHRFRFISTARGG